MGSTAQMLSPWVREAEEPTTRVWKSMVLESLQRPPNPASGVESQERIRCDIMNALAAAKADIDRGGATTPVDILSPLQPSTSRLKTPKAKPPRSQQLNALLANPFLQPRLASDPPPPWVLFAAPLAAVVSRRRRSILPFITLAMLVLIGLGLCADRRARTNTASMMKAQAKVVSVHASKVLVHRGR